MWSRAGPGPGRSCSWKKSAREVPPRMKTARIFFWVTRSGSRAGPRVGQEPAGEEDVALARGEHAGGRELGAAPRVDDRHSVTRGERRAQAVEAQPVVALDRGVRGGV